MLCKVELDKVKGGEMSSGKNNDRREMDEMMQRCDGNSSEVSIPSVKLH